MMLVREVPLFPRQKFESKWFNNVMRSFLNGQDYYDTNKLTQKQISAFEKCMIHNRHCYNGNGKIYESENGRFIAEMTIYHEKHGKRAWLRIHDFWVSKLKFLEYQLEEAEEEGNHSEIQKLQSEIAGLERRIEEDDKKDGYQKAAR